MSDKITSLPGEPIQNSAVAIVTENSSLPALDMSALSGLENIDLSKKKAGAVNLRSSNLKFEDTGEQYRLVYLQTIQVPATDVATGEVKTDSQGAVLMQDACIFYNPSNKGLLMARQTVIVSVCKEIAPQTAVEITYVGDLKSKTGMNYQNFEVFKLVD